MNKINSSVCLGALIASTSINAEVRVDKYFQDNMLIQQDMPITIWGTGNGGEPINVSLCGSTKNTKVNHSGHWEVVFPAKQTDVPCQLTVNEKRIENVIFGELWIAAGQSNIVYKLRQSNTYKDFENHSDSNLRLLRYETQAPLQGKYTDEHFLHSNEKDFFKYEWQASVAKSSSQENFSAVGWHFGRELRESLKVPVGVIQLAVGGSSMTEWIKLETLKKNTITHSVVKEWPLHEMVSPANIKRFKKSFNPEHTLENYKKYTGEVRHLTEPSFLFDAGVKGLKKVSFRGIVWYQGESNSSRPQDFSLLFPMLVKDWRAYFNNSEFPFYYVQLPSFKKETWLQVRAAQESALSVIPNTEMVVTIDLGDRNNIHPADKQPIGKRLANLALNKTYKHKVFWQFPRPVAHEIHNNDLLITYDHVGSGLMSSSIEINGFEVLTGEGDFTPYTATIMSKNKVLIKGVPNTATQIRYAYKPFAKAEVTLTNSAGLPAAPFELALK